MNVMIAIVSIAITFSETASKTSKPPRRSSWWHFLKSSLGLYKFRQKKKGAGSDQIQRFLGIGSMRQGLLGVQPCFKGQNSSINSALFPGGCSNLEEKESEFLPRLCFLSQWINFWRMFHPTCKKKLSLADFEVLELILGNTHMKVKLWCPVSNFRATKQLSLFKMQSATKNKKHNDRPFTRISNYPWQKIDLKKWSLSNLKQVTAMP